ncbi:MAG: TetR/AcrR family transcriptional regulator, partial [Desulfobacterota bacterium]|nr:TetR/AcrR family transcriptional regulator [Thermodesulfobacteriota bacterium]
MIIQFMKSARADFILRPFGASLLGKARSPSNVMKSHGRIASGRSKAMKTRNGEKYFRIINAATKIFAKKGFFQAKVSDIAREAQVADGTIYLYFE